MVQNNQKMFLCYFGAIGHLDGPKKLYKGPEVGRMYVLMSKLGNGSLTKSLGLFL